MMFTFIKNILIPAIKDEVKKNTIQSIEGVLYNKPKNARGRTIYDFLMLKGE